MQARETVLEMIKKCGGEDGGVECSRVAQLLIPNLVDNGKDECGGVADAPVVERVVLEAHLPDGFEILRLFFLKFGDCWIGADARGEDGGFFVRLEVVGGNGNYSPKVVLYMGFVLSRLKEDGRDCLAEAHEVVVRGLTQDWYESLCSLLQ